MSILLWALWHIYTSWWSSTYNRWAQCVGNVSVGSLLLLLLDIWPAYKLGTKGNLPNPTTFNIASAICAKYSCTYYLGSSCHSGVMSPYSSTLTTILARVVRHDTKLNQCTYTVQMCPPLLIGETCAFSRFPLRLDPNSLICQIVTQWRKYPPDPCEMCLFKIVESENNSVTNYICI